jgi:hypothetical protein
VPIEEEEEEEEITKLNKSIQNIRPYIQRYKIEPKEYERSSKTSYGLYIF